MYGMCFEAYNKLFISEFPGGQGISLSWYESNTWAPLYNHLFVTSLTGVIEQGNWYEVANVHLFQALWMLTTRLVLYYITYMFCMFPSEFRCWILKWIHYLFIKLHNIYLMLMLTLLGNFKNLSLLIWTIKYNYLNYCTNMLKSSIIKIKISHGNLKQKNI